MHFTDPWHVTVLRIRGRSFVCPEKSWRPVVKITVMDGDHVYMLPEVTLGSDGQNSNFKSFIPVHGVSGSTSLVLQAFRMSQTKKKHRKPTLVGSARLSLTEIITKYPLPHPRPIHYDVRLSCPPPQRKSPTFGGRQSHSATLTLKFVVPNPTQISRPAFPITDTHSGMNGTLSDGALSSRDTTNTLVASGPHGSQEEAPWKQQEPRALPAAPGLRRRRMKLKGFHVDSETDECEFDSSESWPPTPVEDNLGASYEGEEGASFQPRSLQGAPDETVMSLCILPSRVGNEASVMSARRPLSFAEAILDRWTPYQQLLEAGQDNDLDKAAKVHKELLNEWYAMGGWLLALAGIDAAVFGFAPGALFIVDGFSQCVVATGAAAAGIGLVTDAWFLLLYGSASPEKFQRMAKDLYDSYFFFCLTCRLPSMCMLVSALALMLFLLGVAWSAWPTVVLVMSFVAGVLLTSQFLVFGIHRFMGAIIWVA
ncbi:hypothetical protein FKP32DRAFT_1677105 [Trametes sanguinea]|nr:hypothetical protein FKP32DRAFT_1677105 [Trametes sanguinea]